MIPSISLRDPEVVPRTVAVLRAGGVVSYPTETSYGLGADPCCKSAVDRIYTVKGRSRGLLLPLIASSFTMVCSWFQMDLVSRRLARQYWPGPLTLVLPLKRRSIWHKRLASCLGTSAVAIRVSESDFARKLARRFGRPIIATSANRSGKPSLYSMEQIERQFSRRKFRPDLIVDGGKLPFRPASTIVQIVDGKVQIVRQGGLRMEVK